MAADTLNTQLEEQVVSSVSKIETFIEEKKKPLLIAIGVAIVLICGFFAYKNLYLAKQQDKALAAMWQAEAQFRADSFHIALYGNENVTGFADIVSEYGNTKAGNLACYYAGCCAIHMDEFEDAIKYLKKFDTEDPILEPETKCLLGDAYCQLENYSKAVSYYEKAADIADNEYMSPRFLMKAGLVYEKMGNYSKAEAVYSKIKQEYDGTPEAAVIDKYITRAQLKK